MENSSQSHSYLVKRKSLITRVLSPCRNVICSEALLTYPTFTNTANDIMPESVTHNLIVNKHTEVSVLRGSSSSREIFLDSLTFEDGPDWLSQNVSN